MQQYLRELGMNQVAEHYAKRLQIHRQLRCLFDEEKIEDFTNLALGISDRDGNYSATIHEAAMGPKILSECLPRDVFELARKLDCVEKKHVPITIRNEGIRYLKISIGSEVAMMLRPDQLWVGNKRTYWASLLMEGRDLKRANKALKLYYDRGDDGEMEYQIWNDLYLRAECQLLELGCEATKVAQEAGVESGQLRFLWADAVAGHLFGRFAAKRS